MHPSVNSSTGPSIPLLVFDVGGSHASAAIAGAACLQGTCSSELDSNGAADAILDSIENLGQKVLTACGLPRNNLSGVSLGFPNPFDYREGISYLRHKYGNLFGHDLRSALSRRFGLPAKAITFINDASAYLLGEVHFGAAAGLQRVVGITLGSGLGSSFAVDGQIVSCGEGILNDGFLWNIPYQGGIVEDFVSGPAISALYKQISGRDAEPREIAHRATADADAMKVMQQFGQILGKVLRHTCSGFRPDAIVMGGAISRSAPLFLPAAQEEMNGSGIRLLVSRLFEDAALLGAAIEWRNRTSGYGS